MSPVEVNSTAYPLKSIEPVLAKEPEKMKSRLSKSQAVQRFDAEAKKKKPSVTEPKAAPEVKLKKTATTKSEAAAEAILKKAAAAKPNAGPEAKSKKAATEKPKTAPKRCRQPKKTK